MVGIKCSDCGRFISHKDLESGKAKAHFTPDSDYSCEDTWYECPKCAIKEC